MALFLCPKMIGGPDDAAFLSLHLCEFVVDVGWPTQSCI
jgi:hypothetical protein